MGSVSGVYCIFSTFVSLVDPRDEGVLSDRLAGQVFLQNLDDVTRGQQGEAGFVSHALLANEHHRQHDDRDVVMPGQPAQRLIIGQAALALGVFERAFDPVSVALHARKLMRGCIDRGIRQTIFERLG